MQSVNILKSKAERRTEIALAIIQTQKDLLFCYDDKEMDRHFHQVVQRAFKFADVMMEYMRI